MPRHSRASLLERAARSRPRPRSREGLLTRPCSRSRRRRPPLPNCENSLQQEQKKTAALTQEVGAARQAMTASAEQQRRALDEAQARAAALASELAGTRREVETQAAQLKTADRAATQQRQAAERTIAELRQSLQQERDKIGAMARDLAPSRRPMDQRAPLGRAPDTQISPIVQVTQTASAAATKQPMASDAQDKARGSHD